MAVRLALTLKQARLVRSDIEQLQANEQHSLARDLDSFCPYTGKKKRPLSKGKAKKRYAVLGSRWAVLREFQKGIGEAEKKAAVAAVNRMRKKRAAGGQV